jgi:uncharacterized protein
MSAETAQREPTMEEILASIRRIISEEDRPAESGGDVLDLQPPPAPVVETRAPSRPEPEPAPVFKATPNFDFDAAEELPSRAIDEDLMVLDHEEEAAFESALEPEPEPEPVFTPKAAAPAPAPKTEWRPMEQETLTSEPVASQAAGALSKLMGSMLVSSGATLDDVVRELMKPMLKEWLDANLSAIVEAEVAKEIDRIRRMAR